MASPLEEGGLKDERDAENNIIISDSTLHNILTPQLKNMTYQYNVMCDCMCCISSKIMHSSLLTWRNFRLKHVKDKIHNTKNIMSGEISSHIFGTYKNAVQPYGCHIYNKTEYMAMEPMCNCNYEHHGISYWKCVLRCCDKVPIIVLPSQKENKYTTNTCTTIRFHVYHNVSHCTVDS